MTRSKNKRRETTHSDGRKRRKRHPNSQNKYSGPPSSYLYQPSTYDLYDYTYAYQPTYYPRASYQSPYTPRAAYQPPCQRETSYYWNHYTGNEYPIYHGRSKHIFSENPMFADGSANGYKERTNLSRQYYRNQAFESEVASSEETTTTDAETYDNHPFYRSDKFRYQNGDRRNKVKRCNKPSLNGHNTYNINIKGKRTSTKSSIMRREANNLPNGSPAILHNSVQPSTVRTSQRQQRLSRLQKISNGITQGLERVFYKLGLFIATHPRKIIVACVIIPLLLGIGMIKYKEERDFKALLIPEDSRFPRELDWIRENVQFEIKPITFIVENDNVLTSKTVKAIMNLYTASFAIRVDGHSFKDFCSGISGECVVNSLLDLWQYNTTVIDTLTDDDVVEAVNQTTINPTYFTKFVPDSLLGHVSRDNDGRITSAQATTVMWWIRADRHNATIDNIIKRFEKEMVELGKRGHPDLKDVYIHYKGSFVNEFFDAVYKDMFLLLFGAPFILIYVNLAFGKPNMVENRFLMVIAALSGVILSASACFGFSLLVGLKFGATHAALLFLIVAIGLDDAFVIMEAWKRVERKHPNEPDNIKMALTMKHAGVSVTVTSVSDIAAFAVGISTVMPILSSFCAYSSIGILQLFIIQSTFFPACLYLDQQRIKAKQNGIVPCYVHKNWTPNRFSNIEFVESFFEKYLGPALQSIVGKVVVLIISLGLACGGTWALTNITIGYMFDKALHHTSYAHEFYLAQVEYFPRSGFQVDVYCGKMNYSSNVVQLEGMMDRYKNSSYVLKGSVVSWVKPFKRWLQSLVMHGEHIKLSHDGYPENPTTFKELLFRFTNHDPAGVMFKDFVQMSKDPLEIEMTKYLMVMPYYKDPEVLYKNNINMKEMRLLADSFQPEGTCFVMGEFIFMVIEVDNYVVTELLRNFMLAGACVFIVTLVLIVNLRTSLLVLICVVFTTICLAGTYSLMDYTIDGNMVLFLTFSIGLSVDFSAHVGYMFMTVTGTRNERIQKTLCKIGPAVWHGAFSTFLGFVTLSIAKSHSLRLFFVTFSLICLYGVFFGLCFLPVMLSLVGPEPYDDAELDDIGVMNRWSRAISDVYVIKKDIRRNKHKQESSRRHLNNSFGNNVPTTVHMNDVD